MSNFYKQRLLAHTLPGVKQYDDGSCWAACLEWWAKAHQRKLPRATQNEILADYVNAWVKTDQNFGQVSIPALTRILNEEKWKAKTMEVPSSELSKEFLKGKLVKGPVFVAYYDANRQGGHANVLVAPSIDSSNRETGFIAMEPATGTFQHRTVSQLSLRGAFLAWSK